MKQCLVFRLLPTHEIQTDVSVRSSCLSKTRIALYVEKIGLNRFEITDVPFIKNDVK